MKTITVTDKIWFKLSELKLKENKSSIDEVISDLLKNKKEQTEDGENKEHQI